MRPYLCPVCQGRGIVPAGLYDSTSNYCISNRTTERCRQCDGTGLVWGCESARTQTGVSIRIDVEKEKE